MGGMMSRTGDVMSHTREKSSEKMHDFLGPLKGLLLALALLGLLLLFGSFGLLLGATAALQNGCGENAGNEVLGGVAGFANTSCDKLYSFPWFITFFTGFVFFVVLITLVMGAVHRMRPALIGLLAVLTVLLMFYTNYFYFAETMADNRVGLTGDQGEISTRSRIWYIGGIIGSIASLLLILTLGIHDPAHRDNRSYKESGNTPERRPAPPSGTTEPAGHQPVSAV